MPTDYSVDKEEQSPVDKIRMEVCGDLMLAHHLLGTAPEARPYLQECAAKYEELETVSNEVMMGICTCTWVNS